MLSIATLALALSAAGLVRAHGNVPSYSIAGQNITGYLPYQDPYTNPAPERAMRKIPGNGPVENIDIIDIQCNQGAEPAALVSTIAAGETINLQWTAWPDSHKGPVITYLARAPSDITQWDASDAQWFKIDEAGWTKEDGWAGTDVLTGKRNSIWPVQIPANLKAGQYLLRHEIIALHSAGTYPGAQFYPSCIQLEVTGSGSTLPTQGLVSFPGGYKSTEPGIVYNLYASDDHSDYVLPGPAKWDGVSDTIGDGSSSPAPSSSAAVSTAAPAPTTSAVVSTAVPEPTTSAAEETTAAPEPTTVAPEPATSAAEETTAAPEPTTSAAEEPVSTTSAVDETIAVPVPTTSVAEEPVPTTSAAVTSAPAPAPTSGSGPVTNANVCWRNYNQCLDASQPKPDFTTCGSTRDACLSGARYERLRRSATLGRRFL